jgi:hypothetical protein
LTLHRSNVEHYIQGGATQPTTTKQIPRQVNKRKIAVASEEIMKIRLAVALAGLAFGFDIPTFAQQKDTVDPKVEQKNRACAAKYDGVINEDDPVAVAALHTQDGVHAGGGVQGRKK